MKYLLSFTIDTEADSSDLLDRLTQYAENLAEDLEPSEDWHGREIPAKLDARSVAVEVTA